MFKEIDLQTFKQKKEIYGIEIILFEKYIGDLDVYLITLFQKKDYFEGIKKVKVLLFAFM